MLNILDHRGTQALLAEQLKDTYDVWLNLSLNNTPLSVDEIYAIIKQLEEIVEEYIKNDGWVNLTLLPTINELKPKLLSRDLHTKINISKEFATFLVNTLSKSNLSGIMDAFEFVILRANRYWINTIERTWSIRDRVTEITEPA